MEKCLSAFGCKLCTCGFKENSPDSGVDLEMYLKTRSYLETLYWMLSYTTLNAEPNRHLCRVSTCKKCGKLHCEGVEFPKEKSGNSFLAEVYQSFYQRAYVTKEIFVLTKSTFHLEFLELFDDKDKPFTREWLKRLENPKY